jgi:HK97 family phage prohead protease
MSVIETEPLDGGQQHGPELIKRDFAAELTAGDGRTVDVRIVPYGERIVHDDGLGGVPKGVPYTEEWMPGAFAEQVSAKGRERQVWMNFRHQEGLAGVVGHGLVLREAPDALYGSFKFLDHPDGDKALMLVREGILGGVSLEAKSKKSIRTAAGIVQRVKAHLFGIALTPVGAYSRAVVLALREETVFDEELLPVATNPEVIERCRRLGIALPQRYQAHPDVPDTPPEGGTSEDGTRQSEPNPSS